MKRAGGIHSSSQIRPGSGAFKVVQISKFGIPQNRKRTEPKKHEHAQKNEVRVLDTNGEDITPVPLYYSEPEHPSSSLPSLDVIYSWSDQSKSTSSSNVQTSRLFCGSFIDSSHRSTLSPKDSWTKGTEDSIPVKDVGLNLPAPHKPLLKPDNGHVTEDVLDVIPYVILSETDIIPLLDIPSNFICEDHIHAGTVRDRNVLHSELCRRNSSVGCSVQTLDGVLKPKQTQTTQIIMVDNNSAASVQDMYDSFCGYEDTPVAETSADIIRRGHERVEDSSSTTGSTISQLLDVDVCGTSTSTSTRTNPEPDKFLLSESFAQTLVVMERTITLNVYQPRLAAYKNLPILHDPSITPSENQKEAEEQGSSVPTLEPLWTFGCELTRGLTVTSTVLNKKNPDILAVGYSDADFGSQNQGLICCWSLKNPVWPERVFSTLSGVTSLDFSANNPGQLAAGMYDGSVAFYDVQKEGSSACTASSRDCSRKHLQPVWQVTWTEPGLTSSGDDGDEVLVSVSAEGRISKWLLCSSGLDCIDLMKMQRLPDWKKKPTRFQEKTENILSAVTPAVCVHFHPTCSSIYLVGTWDGFIHQCSFFNSEHYLETYKKHASPVLQVEWSPFNPDVFLSVSSDWTIQLWQRGIFSPLLSFTSVQSQVSSVRWSPNCSTVFAAVNGQQVEIWDLNSSLLLPSIVHRAAAGTTLTSLLFTSGCILVGDTEGRVTVYKIQNLQDREYKQVRSLDDIIKSVSRSC